MGCPKLSAFMHTYYDKEKHFILVIRLICHYEITISHAKLWKLRKVIHCRYLLKNNRNNEGLKI